MTEVLFDPVDLMRQASRMSLYETIKLVWHTIIAETFVDNWHIRYLADEIQKVCERMFEGRDKEYDLIINVPPGTSKSTIVSVVTPMWCWSRKPSCRTIVSTHTFDLGIDLSRRSREVLKTELPTLPGMSYADLHGIELKSDLDSKSHFGTTANGERYVATVGGKNPMGKHAHLLIIDDPIDPEAVFSDASILTANRFCTNTLPSRMVNKTVTPIIVLMQRLHQDDPTGHLLKKYQMSGMPYKHICIPAVETADISPPHLREFYKDGLLDPIRLPQKVLDGIRGTSEYTFASQYLQTPIPVGGGLFNTDKLEERTTSDIPKMVREVRFWDKAASHETGDYTCGVKMGIDEDGKFWILNVQRFQKHSDARERAIKATAQVDGVGCVIGMEQEPGSAGIDSISASIKNLSGWVVKPEKPTGEKSTRAEPFATQVNAGNVYMKLAPWNQEFLEELAYFPHSTHDDQTDASAGAFRLLAGVGRKIAKAI